MSFLMPSSRQLNRFDLILVHDGNHFIGRKFFPSSHFFMFGNEKVARQMNTEEWETISECNSCNLVMLNAFLIQYQQTRHRVVSVLIPKSSCNILNTRLEDISAASAISLTFSFRSFRMIWCTLSTVPQSLQFSSSPDINHQKHLYSHE